MSKGRFAAICILLTLLGAALRFYNIDRMALWGDEACMVFLCKESPGEIVSALSSEDRPDVDVAPPLYFLMLHSWMMKVGDTVTAFRAYSAVFGLLVIPVAIWLGVMLRNRQLGILLGLLTSLNPFQVWYSQEGRMYSMASLLGTLTIAVYLFVLSDPRKKGRWAAFWLVSLSLIYTQYYGLLLLGTIFLHGIRTYFRDLSPSRKEWFYGWVATLAVWITAYLPWVPILFRDYTHAGAPGGFPSFFNPIKTPLFLLLKMTFFGNQNFVLDHMWLYVAGMLSVFLLLGFAVPSFRDNRVMLCLAAVAVPFLIIYAGSLVGMRIYKSHPFIIFQIPLLAVIGTGAMNIRQNIRIIVMSLFVAVQIYVLVTLVLAGDYVKPRTHDAIDFIDTIYNTGDRVAVMPAFIPNPMPIVGDLLVFRYHSRDRFETIYITGDTIIDIYKDISKKFPTGSNLYLVFQDNPQMTDNIRRFRKLMTETFRLKESRFFPSKIRGFTMGVDVYSDSRTVLKQ